MDYELTLVLPEKATPAKKKSVTELVEKLIKTYKGKVVKADDWGKIDFAYPVKKNNSGNFLHFNLQLEPKGARDLGTKIRLEDSIIKHLLVKKGGSASA